MKTVKITKSAIKELIKELFDQDIANKPGENKKDIDPVNVNDIVDPSASLTNPDNKRYVPNNAAEFQVAINALSSDLPDEKFADLYKRVKGAMVDLEKEENSSLMTRGEKKVKSRNKDTKTEAIVRANVRRMLRETGLTQGRPMKSGGRSKGDSSERELEDKEYTFEEIAEEEGFASASGAKQAVERAVEKAQWIASMQLGSPEEIDKIVLQALGDYIKYLNSSQVLSSADVKMLKDHPSVVVELEGFREHLDKYIKRARRDNPMGFPMRKGDIQWPNRPGSGDY